MSVNGIELKEGQIWTTTFFEDVTLTKKGVSPGYSWYCSFGENGFSITEDGKYWDDDSHPVLHECIFSPVDQGYTKFNPKPGDKIICNNGEEFICCTLEFLQEKFSHSLHSSKSILGYDEDCNEWQDWYDNGCAYLDEDSYYNIREVIPAETKEVMKEGEEPRYTVEEVFYAIRQHVGYESPLDYKDGIKRLLKNLDKDPQYKEYLRLKAIYE